MIKFFLIANKLGLIRFSKYYDRSVNRDERTYFEVDLVRKCLLRGKDECAVIEWKNFCIVYRRYASLFFIMGADKEENEFGLYELIHNFVEILDEYFNQVNELDLMFNLEKIHIIVDEMICNGYIMQTSKSKILQPLRAMDKIQMTRIL